MAREFLSRTQAAAYIGMKPNTLDKWRYQGEGPRFLKLGSAIRYERSDLDAYLDSCKRSNTSEVVGL